MRNTTRSRGDTRELKLAEVVVVLGPGTFTLVDLDQDTGLVVGVSPEDLRLLGGDGGVTLDEGGHDTTSGLDTEGKRGNIEEKEILGLLGGVTRENGGLDSGTISDSLIGVDRHAGLLAVEEVGDKFDNTGNTGRTTDEDDFVDVALVDFRVAEHLLNGFERAAEEVLAELFEGRTSDGGVEVGYPCRASRF